MAGAERTHCVASSADDRSRRDGFAGSLACAVMTTEHGQDAAGHRDELPDDLDAAGYVGPYQFPDNSRRRIPALIYLGIAVLCVIGWLGWHDSSAIVNDGWLWAAALLTLVAIYSFTSGWRMHVDEKEALVKAQQAVGWPVGHASAQQ